MRIPAQNLASGRTLVYPTQQRVCGIWETFEAVLHLHATVGDPHPSGAGLMRRVAGGAAEHAVGRRKAPHARSCGPCKVRSRVSTGALTPRERCRVAWQRLERGVRLAPGRRAARPVRSFGASNTPFMASGAKICGVRSLAGWSATGDIRICCLRACCAAAQIRGWLTLVTGHRCLIRAHLPSAPQPRSWHQRRHRMAQPAAAAAARPSPSLHRPSLHPSL